MHIGNIHKLGRLITHDWWSVTDKEGKNKERYIFLFKSRLLVCKVRRISDDRSVFVLKDIIKLPDVQLIDQANTATFELHSKSVPKQIFTAHQEDIKVRWLREISQYTSDPLAIHEHTVDDLRIDPTQIKSDTEGEAFKLPPRIDAHEPDTVKPSEVAQDHYLPHPEKKKAEDIQQVAQQQSETRASTKVEVSKVEQKQIIKETLGQQTEIAQKQHIEESKVQQKTETTDITFEKVFADRKVEDKHSKLVRGTAVASSEQPPDTPKVSAPIQSIELSTVKSVTEPIKPIEPVIVKPIEPVKQVKPAISKPIEKVEPKQEYIVTEPQSVNSSSTSLNTKSNLLIEGKYIAHIYSHFQASIIIYHAFI